MNLHSVRKFTPWIILALAAATVVYRVKLRPIPVVGHTAGEPPDGFHFLSLPELRLSLT